MNAGMPSPEADEIDAIAAIDFEPWTHTEGEWTPPSNVEWAELANPHLVSVRLAWLTLHKSKPELVAITDQLGDHDLIQLVGDIGRSADWFKGMHEILSAAECRVKCAYAKRLTTNNMASGARKAAEPS